MTRKQGRLNSALRTRYEPDPEEREIPPALGMPHASASMLISNNLN